MAGKTLDFGISGRLYRDNVLLYDRETESLWSQVLRQAITGEMTGEKLSTLLFTMTSWKKWKKRHPETLVLSLKTGYRRDYSKDPYEDYYRSPFAFFGSSKATPILSEKTLIFGIEVNGKKRAYAIEKLKNVEGPIKERINGREVTIRFDKASGEVTASQRDGKAIPGLTTYWFVWHKFHPGSTVYGEK